MDPSPTNGRQAFRRLTRRCQGEVLELDLFRHCACGCLTCSHEERQLPHTRQRSFDRYERTQQAFEQLAGLSPNLELPDRVTVWLDEHHAALPRFVTVGWSTEPLPGFEEATALLSESLSRLLAAGVGVSLQTRRNLPDSLIDLLATHPHLVRVTIPLPMLDNRLLQQWEPGTGTATQRLWTVQRLVAARVPTSVSIKPLIPFVNDDGEHLVPLVRAISDAGVKRVGAEFMRLTPTVRRRLEANAPVSTRLLFGAFLERQPEGPTPRTLPDTDLRRAVYRVIASTARARRLQFGLCRCADAYFGRDPCLLWPGDLAPEPTTRRAQAKPRPRRPLSRASQVGLDKLLEGS